MEGLHRVCQRECLDTSHRAINTSKYLDPRIMGSPRISFYLLRNRVIAIVHTGRSRGSLENFSQVSITLRAPRIFLR